MKIISLAAENVKRLSAIEIRPTGNMVEITGKNGQGKTSVLDAIWWALAGTKNVQSAPIRDGETKAVIRLDLGKYVVTRTFKRSDGGQTTTSIVVENGEGARFSSPQDLLNGLLGSLSFDPLAFTRLDKRGQFDALRQFVPGVDFDKIDKANKEDFDERTDLNRKAKELKGAANSIVVPVDTPAEAVDETALIEQLDDAGRHNTDVEQRKAALIRQRGNVITFFEDAKKLQFRAQKLRDEAARLDEEAGFAHASGKSLEEALASAPPIPDPINTAAIREAIRAARDINSDVAQRRKQEGFFAQAADVEKKAVFLTKRMETRAKEKRAAIAAAKMPVPGLGFGDDGGITFNGLPFDQASDAEQLRVSIAIAMASNPELRVIRVRDGSLLDDDAMNLLAEMADKNDCQVWIERVDGSGKVGFVIEDGRLKNAPAQAEAAE